MRIPVVLAGGLFVAIMFSGCGGSGSDGGSIVKPEDPLRSVSFQRDPFRLCFNGSVCTATAAPSLRPTPYDFFEGTRPSPDLTTAGVFPAFGWVVGTTTNKVIVKLLGRYLWQGNRRSGHDRGTLYQVTSVASIDWQDDRIVVKLNTNYAADPTPATLTISNTKSGAVRFHLEPPPGMREAGIAVTLFTIATPSGEGLFGMGARKDFFNQRGKRRHVWTTQQNTGTGGLADLDLAGAGLPIGLPTSDLLELLDLNPDLDDLLLLQERTTFPNGAQAAYWVEAFVVGSRGWAAWTTQMHFQRIDLAATRNDMIRWQLVDSDELTLLFADGGIEAASRAYTAFWGRAPAPPRAMYQPWLDSINEGEGEAAPNGPGFFGGERVRCDVLRFMAKAERYNIPFGVIGMEGWQVVPRGHPAVQTQSVETICTTKAEFKPGANAAGENFFDYVREQGFELAGYFNFFTTNPHCPNPDQPAASCTDSPGVPRASKLAYYKAKSNNYFIESAATGKDFQVTTNRGGTAYIIDFTNPAVFDYWQSQLARMFDLGIYLFMHDFGELTTYKMAFAGAPSATAGHNLYAFEYQHAARQAIADYVLAHKEALPDGIRPYFYARAGMTGACSFTPAVFPGDETTTWDKGHGLPSVIPAMLNLSLSGCYAFTTDIGGYFDFLTPRTREDLFIRWSQLAALTPIMRIHNSSFNRSVYPWTWVEGAHEDPPQYNTIGIFRRYARLKVNLIPLVAHWAQRAAKTGAIGPVRPLILEDQSTPAMNVDYQWLLGHDILVAPVVEDGALRQRVYFPRGARWKRVRVNEQGRFAPTVQVYSGGEHAIVNIAADLANIPIFVRCGALNPLVPIDPEATACE